MKFIFGTKKRMTQVFDEDGRVHAATILEINPATVTAIRTEQEDGYNAVQIGAGEKSERLIPKAQKGQFGKFGTFAKVLEVRDIEIGDLKPGDKLDPTVFEVGDTIRVSAVSKAKGFQGVVKRHGFKGGRRSHGNKHHERTPGSIGATGPARVFKGVRMAGRMGGDKITVKNLKVLQIDTDTNTLVVSGAVPGRRGTFVEVRAM